MKRLSLLLAAALSVPRADGADCHAIRCTATGAKDGRPWHAHGAVPSTNSLFHHALRNPCYTSLLQSKKIHQFPLTEAVLVLLRHEFH